MSENTYKLKTPFTVRLSDDERNLSEERILEMFPDFMDETSSRQMFLALIDRASRQTSKSNQSLPADLEKIQNLENEIGRLKTLIDLKEEELIRVKEENFNLTQAGQGLKLADNQTVITFNPLVALLLDEEIQAAEKKTGKRFTREDVLKNLFWDTIRRISNYPLCLLRSSSEIAAKAKSLKTQA